MPETVIEEKKERKPQLYRDMKLTVKNDSKGDIELSLKGELQVVKVGDNLSGVKSDFFTSDLFRVARIKGVNIVAGFNVGDRKAPKAPKAPKESDEKDAPKE